jgi:hypothetical protein
MEFDRIRHNSISLEIDHFKLGLGLIRNLVGIYLKTGCLINENISEKIFVNCGILSP